MLFYAQALSAQEVSESFVQEIMAAHLDGKPIERDVPAIRELSKFRRIETIIDNVRGTFVDAGLERKTAIYLAHQHSGARLKELGAFFGKKDTAIAQTARRFKGEMAEDDNLRKMVEALEKKLKLSQVET